MKASEKDQRKQEAWRVLPPKTHPSAALEAAPETVALNWACAYLEVHCEAFKAPMALSSSACTSGVRGSSSCKNRSRAKRGPIWNRDCFAYTSPGPLPVPERSTTSAAIAAGAASETTRLATYGATAQPWECSTTVTVPLFVYGWDRRYRAPWDG